MKPILATVPAILPGQRQASTYTDEDMGDYVRRTYAVEDIPLDDLRSSAMARVEKEAEKRFATLDAATIRPMRAVLAQTATDADTEKLAAVEAKADAARQRRASLLAAIDAAPDADTLFALDPTAGWPAP